MRLLNRFRLGTLLFNFCTSLSPSMATFNPTIAGQDPTTTIAPTFPSHASGNSSFSPSQMLNTHIVTRRQLLNTTSDATSASLSSSSAPGGFETSLDTSVRSRCFEVPVFNASSTLTCYAIPSTTKDSHSSVGTSGPGSGDRLAAIICPALGFAPPVLTFAVLFKYQPELYTWFQRNAEERAKDWWRAFRSNRREFKSNRQWNQRQKADAKAMKDWKTWIVRRIIQSQAKDGTPLTEEQVRKIKDLDIVEQLDIWEGMVRLIPASGSETLVDQL